MKVAFIVPYFGKLPNYFQLFLDSCVVNEGFDWLIFTDDKAEYKYPRNVHRIDMTFSECRNLIQSKFDFEIILNKPQKLCDYKVAYGLVFSEYLSNYDFWGHCDLDQIFGDLSKFYTNDLFDKYDKIGSLGHLTIYRNNYKNNVTFMNELNGKLRYKEVFTTEKGCAFDEWLPDNINEIYLNSGKPAFLNNFGADVNPYKTVFCLTHFDVVKRQYWNEDTCNSIFKIEDGHIFQVYVSNGKVIEKEFPYIHLQKRYMNDQRHCDYSNGYMIIPNKFIDSQDCKKLINRCIKYHVLNYQYMKVKLNSLKYRIKNHDWNFTNTFK